MKKCECQCCLMRESAQPGEASQWQDRFIALSKAYDTLLMREIRSCMMACVYGAEMHCDIKQKTLTDVLATPATESKKPVDVFPDVDEDGWPLTKPSSIEGQS